MADKYIAVCLLLTMTLQCAHSERALMLPLMNAMRGGPSRDKCLKEVALDSIDDLRSEKGKSKMACFILCLSKAEGYVDGDGKVVIEKFETNESTSRMTKEVHDELFDCLKKIDSVKECPDIQKVRDCLKLPKL